MPLVPIMIQPNNAFKVTSHQESFNLLLYRPQTQDLKYILFHRFRRNTMEVKGRLKNIKPGTKGCHPQELASFAKVRKFVEQKVDLNKEVDGKGNSILQAAVLENCCKGIIKYLVSHGADTYFTNNDGATALHLCCIHDRLVALKTLLHLSDELNMTDNVGNTPLHYACRKGHLKMVTLLLNKNPSLTMKNKEGNTALHEACYSNSLWASKIVEQLISHGSSANELNVNGELPLHIACREQCSEPIVETLIRVTDDIQSKDQHSRTCLHHAATNTNLNSHLIMVLLIKNNIDITVTDNDKETAFAKGLKLDTKRIFMCLVHASLQLPSDSWDNMVMLMAADSSILPTKTQDDKGNTLLHHVNYQIKEKLQTHLLTLDNDVNIQNIQGITPMHIAAKDDVNCIFRGFLDAGGHITTVGKQNQVPFLIALENNYKEGIYLSIQKKCPEIISFLELNPGLIEKVMRPNKEGNSLLHFACRYHCYTLVKFLLRKGDIKQRPFECRDNLLHKAAKYPKEFSSGRYLFRFRGRDDSRRKSIEDIIELLLSNGLEPSAENKKGLTALAVAFLGPNSIAFRKLLCVAYDAKCKNSDIKIFGQLGINRKNYESDTPLLLALRWGFTSKVIQMLLEMGADCCISTSLVKRPIQIANDLRDIVTVELLMSHGDNLRKPRTLKSWSSAIKNAKTNSEPVSPQYLHSIVEQDDFKALTYVLKSNLKLDINCLYNGHTLLHAAVRQKTFVHTLSLACLLEHGADVNATNAEGRSVCETVLPDAASNRQNTYLLPGRTIGITRMAALRLLTSAGATINKAKHHLGFSDATAQSLLGVSKMEIIRCFVLLGGEKSSISHTFTTELPELFTNPICLKQQCAIVLRKHLKPNAWVGIQKVTLPELLKSYVICGYRLGSLISTDINFQDIVTPV